MQCHLRARWPRASNKGLRPCPLCAEISPVSLNILMMLRTVNYEICKAFAVWHWGMLFLKYSTLFLCTLSQIGESLPIFTSERLWPFLNMHSLAILHPCVLVLHHHQPSTFSPNSQDRKYRGCIQVPRCVLDIEDPSSADLRELCR